MDKQRLKELALSATSSPWKAVLDVEHGDMATIWVEGPGVLVDTLYGVTAVEKAKSNPDIDPDAAYIAAASPETVLALLEENVRLRAENESLSLNYDTVWMLKNINDLAVIGIGTTKSIAEDMRREFVDAEFVETFRHQEDWTYAEEWKRERMQDIKMREIEVRDA